MHSPIARFMLVLLAAAPFGCSPCQCAKPAASSGSQSAASSGSQPAKAGEPTSGGCVVQSDGHNVLRVTVADDVTCTPREGSLHLEMRNHTLEIWLVPDAKTVDEAAERVPQQIMTEFKDFKATGTTHLTIADAPAQRLMGFGIEADDGDPGNADVIVFKVGDNIFMACVHGESLPPSAQQWMLTVVQTAR